MTSFTFPEAIRAVESWFDGAGSTFATKIARSKASKTMEWMLDLQELGYPVKSVRVTLGPLFPAFPCELYVSADLCLQLPHVEETGRVCLGDIAQPADFNDPVAAVIRTITRFKTELLENCANAQWRESQLHDERLSYWGRFCDLRQRKPRGRPRPLRTFVHASAIDNWAIGQVAAFVPSGSRHRRYHTQVITLGDVGAVELATRHSLHGGTVVKGCALFVRIPEDTLWTPSSWPTTFVELDSLVHSATDGLQSVFAWLQTTGWHDRSPDAARSLKKYEVPAGAQPLAVVLCHGDEFYGYQISPSTVSLVTAPHAAPIKVARIDPAWALTRDHKSTTFAQRQNINVLVLGAGSLGSPVIEMLARSGIGRIHVVDSQLFEPPNVSRHVLGMSSIYQAKAASMAARLAKEVPGIKLTGFTAEACSWCADNCRPGLYHLVIDLTAESSVRSFLSRTRDSLFGPVVLIHAWVEHFCAAFHVVATNTSLPWPHNDPAGTRVNSADYSAAHVQVKLPACSEGFHPYGSADIMQAAGFTAERILDIVDNGLADSTVWSYVRAQAFFDALRLPIVTRPIVPTEGGPRDGVMLTRRLVDVLEEGTNVLPN